MTASWRCPRAVIRARPIGREGETVSKILIVDDDPDMVEAGRLVLEKEGHEVGSAANFADGLRKVESTSPTS